VSTRVSAPSPRPLPHPCPPLLRTIEIGASFSFFIFFYEYIFEGFYFLRVRFLFYEYLISFTSGCAALGLGEKTMAVSESVCLV